MFLQCWHDDSGSKGKQRRLTETHLTVTKSFAFSFIFPLYSVVKQLSSYNKWFQGLICNCYFYFNYLIIHNSPHVENDQLQSTVFYPLLYKLRGTKERKGTFFLV